MREYRIRVVRRSSIAAVEIVRGERAAARPVGAMSAIAAPRARKQSTRMWRWVVRCGSCALAGA